ncbi:hypothetical protein [Parerythrobacter jejuensis]|uniref:DUF2178 domain-containing protein n=1 Tax=Parerythrobacter jejuensis TaxID=795812 RepID=A0A845ANB8_9SPHN|nr:hypothetical protein [Parerythrobacter jejuensis]MXP32312.1 hypothetical protein [Parerythrobacter jejuensis]
MTEFETINSGESRLKERRRAFWKYLALAFAAFAVLGFFGGYFGAAFGKGDVPLLVPIGVGLITLIALAWFTWDFFKRIDELDLMDNLWAHLIGQYIALTVFLGWYFLGELGLTTYPTAVAVMLAMILGTFVAYGFRKLGWR